MNVDVIREALTLARDVLWESVSQHPECDDTNMNDAVAIVIANQLSDRFDDCKALVAVDRALKALGEVQDLRTIAWRLGRLELLDTVEGTGDQLGSDVPFVAAADLAAHNAIVDAVRAEQAAKETQ